MSNIHHIHHRPTAIVVIALAFLFLCRASECGLQDDADDVAIDVAKTGLAFANGSFGSTEFTVIVDTGSTTTVLDQQFEKDLAKSHKRREIRLQTTSAMERRWIYENVPICLRPLREARIPAITNDLSNIRKDFGVDVRGILGTTYLSNKALIMDGDVITVGAAGPRALHLDQTFNFSIGHTGVPVVPVSFPVLGNRDVILDTGSTGFIGVTKEQATLLLRTGEAIGIGEQTYRNLSGTVRIPQILIRQLEVMGLRYENVPANVHLVTNLGWEFFRSRKMTLNFPARKIVVESGSGDGISHFPIDASGVRVIWRVDSYYIRDVADASPGDAADIQADDLLETIDGIKASDLSLWAIKERLSAAGTSVRLGLVRDRKKIEVTLPLSRTFEYPPKWKPKRDDADGFLKSLEADTAGKKE